LGENPRRALAKKLGDDAGTIGILHLVKLHHLAADKAAGRADIGASPLTFQPVRASTWGEDRRQGAPQRLGEMELWGLLASGADHVVADLLHERGEGERLVRGERTIVPAGLRAVSAHLALGATHIEARMLPSELLPGEYWTDLTVDPRIDPSRLVDLRGRLLSRDERPKEWISILPNLEKPMTDYLRAASEAREIIDEVLVVPHQPEGPDALGEDRLTWVIPLAFAVDHPWWKGEKLRWIAVPPRRMLRSPDGVDSRRQSLRRAIERVLTIELLMQQFRLVDKKGSDFFALRSQLQKRVVDLLGDPKNPGPASVAARLQGKYGLLRRNLLGSSAVRSARAVLASNPELDPECVELPRWMLEQLGVPIDLPADQRVEFDDVVFVNRQPTLLPYTLIALKAIESDHNVARVHPHLLAALAGDFDGDTLAVHRPTTQRAREDAWNRRRPAAALRSAAAGDLVAPLGLDIALGASLATQDDDARRSFAGGIHARLGSWIPEASGGVDALRAAIGGAPLDEPSAVRAAANRLVALHGEDTIEQRRRSLELLVAFENECFDRATGWRAMTLGLPTGSVELAGLDNPGHARAARAGVLGKESDVRQLLETRGMVTLPTRVQYGAVVDGNYLDGLPSARYGLVAQGALSSLAAKKLVTPFAGALTRALVTVGYEEVINVSDCGAGESHGVLDCPDGRLCAKAYGVDRETGGETTVGRRVGILAAMAIGERSTQQAMKAIHQREGSSDALFTTVREISSRLVKLGAMAPPYKVISESLLASVDSLDDIPELIFDPLVAPRLLMERAREVVDLLGGEDSMNIVHPLVLLRVHQREGRRLQALTDQGGSDSLTDTGGSPRPLSAFSAAVIEGDFTALRPRKAAEVAFDAAEVEPVLVSLVAGTIGQGGDRRE
jgi:hypothetical protein